MNPPRKPNSSAKRLAQDGFQPKRKEVRGGYQPATAQNKPIGPPPNKKNEKPSKKTEGN
jgi:hypothetical protein